MLKEKKGKKGKKDKKDKKRKKEKKKDKKIDRWVVKSVETESLQREEWMLKPSKREEPAPSDLQDQDQPDPPQEQPEKRDERYIQPGSSGSKPLPIIGDGGESWRRKAQENLQKRAQMEGKDYRDLAVNHSHFLGAQFDEKEPEIRKRGEEPRRREELKEIPSEYRDWSESKLKMHEMKAQMRGDGETVKMIKRELERRANPEAEEEKEKEVIVLPQLDIHGKPLFLNKTGGSQMDEELRKMVEHEKMTKGVSNYIDDESHKLAKNHSYKHKSLDDQFDSLDDKQPQKTQKKRKQEPPKLSEEELLKKRAIQSYNAFEQIMENCPRCLEHSKKIAKHLIVSVSNFCFLSLPFNEPFVEGHCYIVPIQHVASSLECDEDTMTEVSNFKKCLIRMFEEEGKRPVFIETCKDITNKSHTYIEVIPLEEDLFYQVPFFFKKALYESEEVLNTWQAENKKLLDTKDKKLVNVIPKNFPYFHVEFTERGVGGYCHLIESQTSFQYYYGREVIGGLLEKEPHTWRNPARNDHRQQMERVNKFKKKWENFDWTKQL